MAQLELYRKMGCTRDILAHPEYQNWIYQRALEKSVYSAPTPSEIRYIDEIKSDRDEKETDNLIELRCRKCRSVNFILSPS